MKALRELYNTKSKWELIDMQFKRELYFMKAKRELSYTESKRELNYKNLAAFHFTFSFIYFKILHGMIIIILIYSRGRDGSSPFGWSHQKKKVNDLYLHFLLNILTTLENIFFLFRFGVRVFFSEVHS